mmetsp:Transcript_95500/g.294607  ORF Transcript_95500/g.294607 Transcript_95500/m.294607 type:complete len:335 (-) Transcript_95500:1660-2664(-)
MGLQSMVSCRVPWQGLPSNEGIWMMERSRYLCPIFPFISQADHSVQSDRPQSLLSAFGSTQRLVSAVTPWHWDPHSLLCRRMSRFRSQSPASVGWLHSLQAANWQSRGMHGGVHGVEASQVVRLSCAPWHLAPCAAGKSAPLGEDVRLSARLRIAVPWPQPTSHPDSPDHGAHEQKSSALQCPLHLSTSLAVVRSHILPQWLGIWWMERCLYLSPWQPPEQSPHSDQSPQTQSRQVSIAQASVLHGPVTVSSLSQGFPPLLGRVRTLRERSRWPPPQCLEQVDQSPQAPRAQSDGPAAWHAPGTASSGPGLHGPISFSGDMWQCFPLPAAKTLM